MELGVMNVLQAHLRQAQEHPALHTLLREHLLDTEHHAEDVKQCLKLLGSPVSVPRNGVTKAATFLSDALQFRMRSPVESTIIDLATEHFEIACYISLISAATDLGELGIVEICENILEEEESMADHLMVQLPEITSTYLEILYLERRKSLRNANGSNNTDAPFALKRVYPNSNSRPAAKGTEPVARHLSTPGE